MRWSEVECKLSLTLEEEFPNCKLSLTLEEEVPDCKLSLTLEEVPNWKLSLSFKWKEVST